MKTILQIRTRPDDILADQARPINAAGEEVTVETFELGAGPADYEALLEAVFRADCVQVW